LAVPSNFTEIFQYLCQSPQVVCFAAFKELNQRSPSPKITLLCAANHDEGRMEKMRGKMAMLMKTIFISIFIYLKKKLI
jgi:hypothetical protein